ncbi:TetR/AcrR family transcriptional regulator [Oceanobacillus sp. Castelsardo]|uniref:TetR/AcrR family transcriptional regulator n=1 Tax=Oceanobacillus sp. Castelsardo TaxID=1851204 RepID=UPI00083891A5|nr:TetR/AcrR family transcriptional regulator [Oceanobacillus sp. Castelsardo]
MSAVKIRNIALSHFANYGYEGASLNEIAKEVGIKKATIYSHYKGKDDLFFSVVKYVFHLERRNILLYFQSSEQKPIKIKLEDFFGFIEERFNQSDSAKLLLRICFFPPWNLRFELSKIVNSFLDGMQRLLVKLMKYHQKNNELNGVNINKAALAYITLVDGVIIELLFTGKNKYFERINVTFPIYWQGIKSINKE